MRIRDLALLTTILLITTSVTCSEGYGNAERSLFVKNKAYNKLEEPNFLTLRYAITLALLKNPELRAYSSEIHAREAKALQARLLPNPEVGITIENFAGQGDYRGFDAAETSIEISQLILLAGKRQKRCKVASLEYDIARWEYKIKQLDIINATSTAFVDVLKAQDQLRLSKELLSLANKIYRTVVERVKSGQVSPIEKTRASIILSTAQIQLEKSENRLKAARKRLAAMWGCKSPHFKKAVGRLDNVHPIPSMDLLNKLVEKNPEITRWMIEIKRAKAVLELERSKRIPDMKLSWGMRRLEETDDYAFLFSFSIPLPIFNRNQGGIREAHYRLSQAYEKKDAVELAIRTELAKAYKALASAYTEVSTLKERILPAAQKTFYAIREGYKKGKFGYLDVLNAQKTLFDSKRQYVKALASYHRAKIYLLRLVGQSLKDMEANQSLKEDM